jgi:NAD(P)-dependent dehydrogenase (short-subunit alcohol dehydrogenase family)
MRPTAPMKPGGAIVMNGSVTDIQGSKNLLDYSMTKGGIHAFTRSLSGHLLERGIRLNAIVPGPVWTPLNPADKEAKAVAQFVVQTPMGRPAQPEEIARTSSSWSPPAARATSPARCCRSSAATAASHGRWCNAEPIAGLRVAPAVDRLMNGSVSMQSNRRAHRCQTTKRRSRPTRRAR